MSAGLQSEYCIRATTLGALSRDLEVTLVSNGHGTYDSAGRAASEISAASPWLLSARPQLPRYVEYPNGLTSSGTW